MTEEAKVWEPVPRIREIDGPFHSIAFAFSPYESSSSEGRKIRITMHGTRDPCLCFKGAIALRFEDDCPGFDPLPDTLPMLRERVTLPLLQITQSRWLGQWGPIHASHRLTHFVLLSLDDLVQLIAAPEVEASWV